MSQLTEYVTVNVTTGIAYKEKKKQAAFNGQDVTATIYHAQLRFQLEKCIPSHKWTHNIRNMVEFLSDEFLLI